MMHPVFRRRGLLGALGSLGTAGCGFRPVYAVRDLGGSQRAADGLAATEVTRIPERAGQLLRGALQERFERFGAGVTPRYALRADILITDDANGVAADSSVTRIRVIGNTNYTVVALGTQRTLTSGTARAVDGYDVLNQQYFASDLAGETVVRRLAEALADQVALQLATYFDAHGAG